MSGAAIPSLTAGAVTADSDKAVTLNGSSQYGTVPDSNQLDKTNSFSLELWVKRTKDRSVQAIVGKPLTTTAANENYGLWFDNKNKLSFEVGSGTNKSAKLSSAAALDTNWHYVVGIFASGVLKLYVDGVLSSSMTTNGFTSAGTNASTLDIGRSATSNYYGGSLDELALYGTALSASQVSNHFGKGTTPPPVPPSVSYSYNADDELLTSTGGRSFGYDANGNETTASGNPLTYDMANRLISRGGVAYTYDGDGNRLRTCVAGANNCGSSPISTYAWDTNGPLPQLALERNSSGGLQRRYVYGASRISMSTAATTSTTTTTRSARSAISHLRAEPTSGPTATSPSAQAEPASRTTRARPPIRCSSRASTSTRPGSTTCARGNMTPHSAAFSRRTRSRRRSPTRTSLLTSTRTLGRVFLQIRPAFVLP